ncbi:MAG: carbonic anhydrase [Candidatus Moranbacteria bacterium]|nr:carbonic anhydrase [Candidatus Moranbacteria bacterium]
MTGQKVLYRAKWKYRGAHECDAAVIACIDFRFWRETAEFVDNYFGAISYDYPGLPGAAKAINESSGEDLAFSCVGVPCDLHQVKKIILVNHEDCGAYGGSGKFDGDKEAEQEFHEDELRKAWGLIKDKYPEKDIHLVYARIGGEGNELEFLEVDLGE